MANNSNKKALFWTSYSDLMTSMFFAMLVLFVVAVVAMGAVNKQLQEALKRAYAEKEDLEQIVNLKKQFKTLTNSTSLGFDDEKGMFYAKDFVGIEIFNPNDTTIKEEYISKVDKVGKDIKNILDSLTINSKNFKYQLVIEGMAAIPYKQLTSGTFNPDNEDMYMLSYRRALALYKRWKNLNLRKSNTEIIIAGSGFNGINRDMDNEDNNKRFIIQIIPKLDKPMIEGGSENE